MNSNKFLREAKKDVHDEFYTQYEDIQKEMNAYLEYNPDVFKDKTILLPCDDPDKSNFTKFFVDNFEKFGLKKLISTCYVNNIYQISLLEYFNDNIPKMKNHGKLFILEKDGKIMRRLLKGNGDYRSDEVTRFRNDSDIIITNPPFSKFRDFFRWIIEAKKQFIIMGTQLCAMYSTIFPFIKEQKVWYGNSIHGGGRSFQIPAIYFENYKRTTVELGNIRWFTNIKYGCIYQRM